MVGWLTCQEQQGKKEHEHKHPVIRGEKAVVRLDGRTDRRTDGGGLVAWWATCVWAPNPSVLGDLDLSCLPRHLSTIGTTGGTTPSGAPDTLIVGYY